MLMMTRRRVTVIVMMMILVDLVDQPEVLQVHVGRCRQPKGRQQQRHNAPNRNHAKMMCGNECRFKAAVCDGAGPGQQLP